MTIDFEQGRVEVHTVAGEVVRQPGGSWASQPLDGPLDFKRVTFCPSELVIKMVTPWDEELEAELFNYDDQDMRRKDRPVIYLDQNKWVQDRSCRPSL